MRVDPSMLLTFCRVVEETADSGLELFTKADLVQTAAALEDLKDEIDRKLARLSSLMSQPIH